MFRFTRIDPFDAKELLSNGFISAIGHASTARLMSEIIGTEIPYNRITIHMKAGDKAIVLWLLERPHEGQVYSADDLEKLPCELGLLERIS